MRMKKGFTLAEILIVLMVIGVIATMTIPSLMKGVTEAQYKAAYKKAYNTIVNLVAMEKISGQLPSQADSTQAAIFMSSMVSNLSVKEFIASNKLDSGVVALAGQAVPRIVVASQVLGPQQGASANGITPTAGSDASWVITDDGIGYAVVLGGTGGSDCANKAEINAAVSAASAIKLSCMVVVVDVNGLYKGPNRIERQSTVAGSFSGNADEVASTAKMTTLSRDRYYIYVGADGATHGNAAYTVSGRIINDLK